MSDQQQTTPEVDANNPGEGTGTQEERDFQALYEQEKQRADNLQPEFTRATQQLSQYEPTVSLVNAAESGDPDAQRELLSRLGYELPDEEEDNQVDDDLDPRVRQYLDAQEQRISQFEQTQAQRDQEAAEEEWKDSVVANLAAEEYPEGLRPLVADVALNLAQQNPSVPVDIEKAKASIEWLLLQGVDLPAVQAAVKKQWQKTKPSAAVTQAGGVQATHTQSLDSRAKRADFIAQQLAADDD